MIRPGSPASESLMLLSDTPEISAVSVKKYYKWPFEQFNLSYISGLIEGCVECCVKWSRVQKEREMISSRVYMHITTLENHPLSLRHLKSYSESVHPSPKSGSILKLIEIVREVETKWLVATCFQILRETRL